MKTYQVVNLMTGKVTAIESDSVENAVYAVLIDVLGIENYEDFTEIYTRHGFSLVSHADDRFVLSASF